MDVIRNYCSTNHIRFMDLSRFSAYDALRMATVNARVEKSALLVIDYSVADTALKNALYKEEFCDPDSILVLWKIAIIPIAPDDITDLTLKRVIDLDGADDECPICLGDEGQDRIMCQTCRMPYCLTCFKNQAGVCAFCAGEMPMETLVGLQDRKEKLKANMRRRMEEATKQAKANARATPMAIEVKQKYKDTIKALRNKRR